MDEPCFDDFIDYTDYDAYNLIFSLVRDVKSLEHQIIRLRQEINRLSPEKDLRRKPYQDIFSDLSNYYNGHPAVEKYIEIYHEDPYDGEWGTFPDLSTFEENLLGKKGTY